MFNNAWCICSYYAPHGLPQETRVSFWRDSVAVAQRVQNAVSVPMVIAGDANVWHPHFNLSRSRSCDVPIIPFLDLLMASCRLELCNAPDRATHISGGGLDCIFISSGHVVDVVVHDGLQCCTSSPVCCPVLGSNHFLCIAAGLSLPTSRPSAWTKLPPLRDWRPTLIRASSFSGVRESKISASPPSRRQLLDGVFNEMIAILHHHARSTMSPSPQTAFLVDSRMSPSMCCWNGAPSPQTAFLVDSRMSPSMCCWNGAWRDHRRAPSAATRERFRNARTSFHRVVCRCQNQFWSDWQENLTSLSRVNPRAAASRVRQMFSGQYASGLVATVLILRTFPDRHCGAVAATFRFSWVTIFWCVRRGLP